MFIFSRLAVIFKLIVKYWILVEWGFHYSLGMGSNNATLLNQTVKTLIITFRVSGRGNIIGLCVCLFVCL